MDRLDLESSLSKGHMIVWVDGTRIDVHSYYTQHKGRQGGGPRGKVSTFTDASRLRLLKSITRVKSKSIQGGLFITLTYHKNYVEPTKLKRDLRRFLRILRRTYPSHAGFWKLEPQKRGSPHFHLLHMRDGRADFIHHKWIAERWNGICDPNNHKHLKAGTSIERCRTALDAGKYVSKYVGKSMPGTQPLLNVGRFWGIYNRSALPVSGAEVVTINHSTARDLIEDRLRGKPGSGSHCSSCTIFTRPGETYSSMRALLELDRT